MQNAPVRLRCSVDIEPYARAVVPFLEAEPCGRNVLRTLIDAVRIDRATGGEAPCYWWVDDAGVVTGAAQWTPPFPLLVTSLPAPATNLLAAAAVRRATEIGVPLSGVSGPRLHAERVASEAARLLGVTAAMHSLQLLQETSAVRDVPHPGGRRETPRAEHVDLLTTWLRAFEVDAHVTRSPDPRHWVERGVTSGILQMWLVGDDPVSFAGARGPAAGVTRLGPVYTPAQHRGRGYARRLVAEMTAAALASGAAHCMLYVDAANRVADSIYAQIGYVTSAEHVEIRLR